MFELSLTTKHWKMSSMCVCDYQPYHQQEQVVVQYSLGAVWFLGITWPQHTGVEVWQYAWKARPYHEVHIQQMSESACFPSHTAPYVPFLYRHHLSALHFQCALGTKVNNTSVNNVTLCRYGVAQPFNQPYRRLIGHCENYAVQHSLKYY